MELTFLLQKDRPQTREYVNHVTSHCGLHAEENIAVLCGSNWGVGEELALGCVVMGTLNKGRSKTWQDGREHFRPAEWPARRPWGGEELGLFQQHRDVTGEWKVFGPERARTRGGDLASRTTGAVGRSEDLFPSVTRSHVSV